jgi:hypothetical protein
MTGSDSSGGGTKYEIPDDHEWADKKTAETEDRPPRAEVKSHTVEILHRSRDRTGGRDIRYRFIFDEGTIIGISRSHRLAESNQFDPMGSVAPEAIPGIVKRLLADEMDVGHWSDVVDVDRAARLADTYNHD